MAPWSYLFVHNYLVLQGLLFWVCVYSLWHYCAKTTLHYAINIDHKRSLKIVQRIGTMLLRWDFNLNWKKSKTDHTILHSFFSMQQSIIILVPTHSLNNILTFFLPLSTLSYSTYLYSPSLWWIPKTTFLLAFARKYWLRLPTLTTLASTDLHSLSHAYNCLQLKPIACTGLHSPSIYFYLHPLAFT